MSRQVSYLLQSYQRSLWSIDILIGKRSLKFMGFWISMSFKICNYVYLSLLAALIMCRDLFPVWRQDCAYWLLFLRILFPFCSTLCPIRQWFIIFSSLCSQLCKPKSSLLCGLVKVPALKQDSFENKFITRPRGEVNYLWFFFSAGNGKQGLIPARQVL